MKSTKSHPISRATFLRPSEPEALKTDMEQIQLAIARRAYELFEARNREHGHDLKDWFQAESELLRPVSVAISEAPDGYSIRANILGLSEKELKVGIEPKCISIVGRKEARATTEAPAADSHRDQILRLIALSEEIDPTGAVVELRSGVLRFELPRLVRTEAKAAGAA
jgi:HSP20 family molecular chaperone IbpA